MNRDLTSWYPVNIKSANTDKQVDWRFLPDRFRESFFSDTISKNRNSPEKKPENLLPDIDYLINSAANFTNVIKPSALIFHVSRCGSTLVSQMLASLDRSIVISESEIINQTIHPEQFINSKKYDKYELFKTVLKYFGRKRFPDESNLFIKLDSWHIFNYEFINSALPDVPKIILYRNPLEVVLSHNAIRGIQMVPGTINIEEFAHKPFNWECYEHDKYTVLVIYNFLKSILKILKDNSNILLMNYSQLPDSLWNNFAVFTGINFSLDEISRMKKTTKVHSKQKGIMYKGDSYLSDFRIDKEIENLIESYLKPAYYELEEVRNLSGF